MDTKTLTQEDILHFLRQLAFRNYDNPFVAASEKAYLDFCRTIRFFKAETPLTNEQSDRRQNVKDSISAMIQNRIELLSQSDVNKESFDVWHTEICETIIEMFSSEATLLYGQAQKWINMSMKYLLSLDNKAVINLIPWLHVPIDNNILTTAYDQLGIPIPLKRWSRWNKNDYLTYQSKLIQSINSIFQKIHPIIWEMRTWQPNE
jgi:hypothetical protein